MREKRLTNVFVYLCLLLVLIPSVGMLLTGPSEAGANERLSPDPMLRTQEGRLNPAFLSECIDYMEDHFCLRQEWISLRNALDAALFSSTGADGVLLGRDGWLYYADTLDDYTGIAPMTAREVFCAGRNLLLMQRYCELQGASFAFTAAPNKNSLYPEHMRGYTGSVSEKDADRLYAQLAAQGTPYVDLHASFSEQNETLYFAHDSHWNSRGAALAADRILDQFGRDSQYFAEDFSECVHHDGDLYAMQYPAFRDTETDLLYAPGFTFVRTDGGTQADAIRITTQGSREGALLCWRDSFGNLLYPYLAEAFGSAQFSRATRYDLTAVEAGNCVLVELVERNLDYLIENVPLMPAPAYAAFAADITCKAVYGAQPSSVPGCRLVSGTLPAEPDPASPVYLADESTGAMYEAFLLADNGYAAHIPEAASCSVLLWYSDGTICAAGLREETSTRE